MPHHKLIRALKAACPTITVRVRLMALPEGLCGDCRRKNGFFLVRINNKKTYLEQVDTLIHEFAHAEAFLEWEATGQHGPVWGVSVAKFYRVMEAVLH
jgi:hypothetical protein